MVEIKITSNPYEKQLKYERKDGENWEPITNAAFSTHDVAPNNFFTFIANNIFDKIIEQYYTGSEKVDITFSGTEEEYKILEDTCREYKYDSKITLKQGNEYLSDSNKVLSEIRLVFNELDKLIHSIITDNTIIDQNLAKVIDASNETVPICVVGNYSCGKSTLINALIGHEILLSRNEPTTSRIYKISSASPNEQIRVSFRYQNQPVEIIFNSNNILFSPAETESCFAGNLKKELEELKENPPIEQLKCALRYFDRIISVSTDQDEDAETVEFCIEEEKKFGQLIELTIPFNGAYNVDFPGKLVIFDTPGSNSDSNPEHIKVLENAMQGLTNGLLIYVTTNDALDTKDNMELIEKVSHIEGFDKRFSIIAVNKSDETQFDEYRPNKIMRLAIPKSIFSEGLFYISSVMGLGAKTNGQFDKKDYGRTFRKNNYLFSGEEKEDEISLYAYNILPGILKKRMFSIAADCENTIYRNSGLYSLEREIGVFASHYAAYNKCRQSKTYLNEIKDEILQTSAKKKATLREQNVKITCEFVKLKETVRDEIESAGIQILEDIESEYYTKTKKKILSKVDLLDINEFSIRKNRLYEKHREMSKVQYLTAKIEEITENYDNISEVSLIDTFRETGRLTKKLFLLKKQLSDENKNINQKVADDLVKYANEYLEHGCVALKKSIAETSVQYFRDAITTFRKRMSRKIENSDNISEENKRELLEIIQTTSIDLDSISFVDIPNYKPVENLGKISNAIYRIFEDIPVFSDIKQEKDIANRCNQELQDIADKIFRAISDAHLSCFRAWENSIVVPMVENPVKYNNNLIEMEKQFAECQKEIEFLEKTRQSIVDDFVLIENKMSWKTFIN